MWFHQQAATARLVTDEERKCGSACELLVCSWTSRWHRAPERGSAVTLWHRAVLNKACVYSRLDIADKNLEAPQSFDLVSSSHWAVSAGALNPLPSDCVLSEKKSYDTWLLVQDFYSSTLTLEWKHLPKRTHGAVAQSPAVTPRSCCDKGTVVYSSRGHSDGERWERPIPGRADPLLASPGRSQLGT